MKRLLREPLLHFLLLGAAIFALFAWLGGDGERGGEIVVTRGEIQSLAVGFARTWQRPPSAEELAGLVRERVREEAAAREAIALGLDRDDTVVRRRLRQKLEFLAEDAAALAEPNETELAAFLAAHPEKFRREARYGFRQVHLSDERGERLAADAARLLAALRAAGPDAEIAGRGDSRLLEPELADVPASEVASRFGAAFAESLATLPVGEWQGPVASGFGVHLVLVRQRTEGSLPTLAEARETVVREWTAARRAEAMEAFYRDLLARYRVTVEAPAPAPAERVAEVGP